MKKIEVKPGAQFKDYRAYGALTNTVKDFLDYAQDPAKDLKGCTIWMINSTAIGGGVAEMLPSQMRLMRELGLKIEWLVIEASDPHFFDLTKRIHNAIHGSGDGVFTDDDRSIFEHENNKNLEKSLSFIQDGDIVVIHDPQPMPLGHLIRQHKNVKLVWRCHIGLEEHNDTTRGVWSFLKKYLDDYDHFVFSLEAYVPPELKERTTLITPAIDPLSHKNRMLNMHKCIGILHHSGILNHKDPVIYPMYEHQVRRIMPDGTFGAVNSHSDFDMIYRPTVAEISRWDRLKGFKELMDAFILMKKQNENNPDKNSVPYKRIRNTRLILGGPDPKFVSDDPEGMEVLNELISQYRSVDAKLQEDIAILLLPLDNPKENALIVNAIQNSSSIVAQNSIQEGFGLTATEAMWKKKPVLVSGAAGLVRQVVDGETGRINKEPTDIPALAKTLEEMLNNPLDRDMWGFNAQVRVIENFTLFSQLLNWMSMLAAVRKT